jgi:DNA-binding protein HU-beta
MRLTDPQGLDLISQGNHCPNKFHQHSQAIGTDVSSDTGPLGFNTQRFIVNKTELIEHIAKHADLSKAAAGRALEATIGAVRTTLKKGGTVSLVGFGTFAVGKRAARTGRNPRTGAAIKIKKANVPKFRPGKGLKDALN